MSKNNDAVLVTASNYYELGEKYQRENQKEKTLILLGNEQEIFSEMDMPFFYCKVVDISTFARGETLPSTADIPLFIDWAKSLYEVTLQHLKRIQREEHVDIFTPFASVHLNADYLGSFDLWCEKFHWERRPKHLVVERYHNNTHRLKIHLLLLNHLFRTQPDHQSKTTMCRALYYYLYRDHFRDLESLFTLYSSKCAVEWYRDDSGISQVVNRALRVKNVDDIHILRHFMIELYQQLDEIYERQRPTDENHMTLTVYRGQQVCRNELRNFIENIGQASFINSFFSTTFNLEVAYLYLETNTTNAQIVNVVFVVELDTSHVTRPYGYITNSSEENELIISPGTIVSIQNVERINKGSVECNNMQSDNQKNEFWLIKLQSIDEKQFLGSTLTILSETSMIGAGEPVVICFLLFFVKVA
ncbi:unnamed protein product [Adineta ricciae]|uniref:Uncharacterized protein n=1 Tax=Adineta ricciae TaxID=249248 RepID=A0A815WH55_ADIRI|nr:unnamed protein product [Adineta ricciae]CAF1545861.1 unnamed protein product [Adineta ricciae]